VTADEIADPNNLRIQGRLNGKTMQDSSTSNMLFNIRTLIAFLSGSMTLLPGTVILTGTPEGVGMAKDPPLWLKPGDVYEVEIEGIGTLSNPVVLEPV
jgi:2-keto-4-pentenoate hydratase/2-oxohepta-3-ene-1,7-dioic acid hydratase in catechol pathway